MLNLKCLPIVALLALLGGMPVAAQAGRNPGPPSRISSRSLPPAATFVMAAPPALLERSHDGVSASAIMIEASKEQSALLTALAQSRIDHSLAVVEHRRAMTDRLKAQKEHQRALLKAAMGSNKQE